MFKVLSKVVGICGYVVQYGCLTHCTFEYLGDFVVCVGPSMEPTLHTNNVLVTDRVSPRINHLQRGDIIISRSPTNPQQHVCKRIIGMPGDRIMTRASFNLNPLSNTYTIHTSVISTGGEASTIASTSDSVLDQKLHQKADIVSGSVDAKSNRQEPQPAATSVRFTGVEESVEIVDHHPPHPEIRTSIVTVPRGHLWIEGDNIHNSSDSRNYGPVPIGLVKSRAVCRVWPPTQFRLFI
ncbi:mitochondrial inner membrane protease subunit 1 [Uranotaenia lowii]|uniref:mitochondrial inner membrane protease subunit 1 n=1 Tax=Uranotaenia lowii TaxID=190385 RepID=UPI00247878D9|nr:mitochondrial inner membrane protease subunit 1 [Uranotaenia lowii]